MVIKIHLHLSYLIQVFLYLHIYFVETHFFVQREKEESDLNGVDCAA